MLTLIPASLPTVLLKSSTIPVMILLPTGSMAGDQNSSSTTSAAEADRGIATLPAAATAAAPAAEPWRNVRRFSFGDTIDAILSSTSLPIGPREHDAVTLLPGLPVCEESLVAPS